MYNQYYKRYYCFRSIFALPYPLKLVQRFLRLVIDHPTIMLTLLFSVGTGVILLHLEKLSEVQIQSMALQNAKLYAETLTELRAIYASEVVSTALKNGLKVDHNYKQNNQTIPLPATLGMLLGEQLANNEGGLKTKLYSAYPFPWREHTGGLQDDFARSAWQALTNNPTQPYYRIEEIDGITSLRYAIADIMRESCIECHNTQINSPKVDWKAGEVRGILEVITPIESNIVLANGMLLQTFYLLTGILLGSLIGIGFIMRRLRIHSERSRLMAEEATLINRRLAQEMQVRKSAEKDLLKLTYTDALTDIANRRKFNEEMSSEWKRALRYKTHLAVIMIDIDNFKSYNDNYGHQAGDETLCLVAKILSGIKLRSSDLAARFGGEEFVLLLPQTELEGAIQVAENIRKAVEQHAIVHEFARASDYITISAGVTSVIPLQNQTTDEIINTADKALYLAKESGRNCVKSIKIT